MTHWPTGREGESGDERSQETCLYVESLICSLRIVILTLQFFSGRPKAAWWSVGSRAFPARRENGVMWIPVVEIRRLSFFPKKYLEGKT